MSRGSKVVSLFFQKLLEAQNRRIDELVERIKQQQDKLDKQNGRIRNLQSQVRQVAAAVSLISSPLLLKRI